MVEKAKNRGNADAYRGFLTRYTAKIHYFRRIISM